MEFLMDATRHPEMKSDALVSVLREAPEFAR
jgi:hypothetical protein